MDDEPIMDPELWAWLRNRAAARHGGDWRRTVIEILEGARAAERDPDLWAGLRAQQQYRAKSST